MSAKVPQDGNSAARRAWSRLAIAAMAFASQARDYSPRDDQSRLRRAKVELAAAAFEFAAQSCETGGESAIADLLRRIAAQSVERCPGASGGTLEAPTGEKAPHE